MACEQKGPRTAGNCEPRSPSVRNRYFRSKLITATDYRMEQAYFIQRRRLVNRSVLGWGLVWGFPVGAHARGGIAVGSGVALDRRGRELVGCETVVLSSHQDVIWVQRGADGCGTAGAKPGPGSYRLDVHYAECLVDGVRVDEGCGQSTCEWNHVCETVVFALWPVCECQRPGCSAPLYSCHECDSSDSAKPVEGGKANVVAVDDRGPQATLCRWSREWRDRDDLDPCRSASLYKVGKLSVDLDAGVALACVNVAEDACGGFVLKTVEDDCTPRRLVRTNDALFDLIRGCDLTRIKDIGWHAWHEKPVPTIALARFREMFVKPPDEPEPAEGSETEQGPRPEPEPVDTKFWVCFSGPVQIESLTRDVMTISLVRREEDEDLGNVLRIPVTDLKAEPTTTGDPEGTTRCMRPRVSRRFWYGELSRYTSSGFEGGRILVEIRIRCDAIVDWAGQAVDGNAIGRRLPSGNGTPGGDFASIFSVRRHGDPTSAYPPAKASSA